MMNEFEIRAVISELNRIEVHGDKNLDILLGCISYMKSKVKEIVDEKKKYMAEADKKKFKNAEPELDIPMEGVDK
jgi:hypothetical protein